MPEVVRGSRTRSQTGEASPATSPLTSIPTGRSSFFNQDGAASVPLPETPHDPSSPLASPTTPTVRRGTVRFDSERDPTSPASPIEETNSRTSTSRRKSSQWGRRSSEWRRDRRQSVERAEKDVYYDSRAATKREFRRRATTLQQYYQDNPDLLPQLPFTWKHGFKRWKLYALIAIMFIDACIIPLVLYYAMNFAGNVQGYIIFAVVATIWGGPTYLEFAIRSWRLIKKENFFRPLGQTSRKQFDITHWICVLVIGSVTALLIVGSAPHIVFLRVLAMPGPAILITLGGSIFLLTLYSEMGWKAPFRISSTPKGGKVLPGVYYLIEDIVAVNAGAGRPYREALAARYEASPRFRLMMRTQSLFWSVPSLAVALVCTVLICVHEIPNNVGYGIGWGVPFVWAAIWAAISVPWVKRTMRQERIAWETDKGTVPTDTDTPDTPDAEAIKQDIEDSRGDLGTSPSDQDAPLRPGRLPPINTHPDNARKNSGAMNGSVLHKEEDEEASSTTATGPAENGVVAIPMLSREGVAANGAVPGSMHGEEGRGQGVGELAFQPAP